MAPWGTVDTFQGHCRNLNILIFPFLLLLKCDFNELSSLLIIHFTAMIYLSQFRADRCFLEKIVMMDSVIGVPQYMEYAFRAPSVKKKS
jgi:hypothetical protein